MTAPRMHRERIDSTTPALVDELADAQSAETIPFAQGPNPGDQSAWISLLDRGNQERDRNAVPRDGVALPLAYVFQ